MSSGIRSSLSRTRYNITLQKNVGAELQFFERHLFTSKVLSGSIWCKRPKPIQYIRCKANAFMQWYEEFSGLNEVREAQAKVVEAGDKFMRAQEERRVAALALGDVEKRLKALYAELDNTKRGDERYLFLITEEHKLLKEEQSFQEDFTEAERTEREFFNILSTSVKHSHEKERNQAEKTKYWSIIGSVIGTVIGIIGTSINNHFKIAELKALVHQSSTVEMKEKLKTCAENIEKILDSISKFKAGDSIVMQNDGKSIEVLLKSISSKLENVAGVVHKIQEDTKIDANKVHFDQENEEAGEQLVLQFNSLTETIERESTDIKCFIVSASLFCLVVVIIAKIIQA